MSDSQTFQLDIQLLADDLPAHLTPDALRLRLAELIRRYVQAPSAQLAETVVKHVQALYLHPAMRYAADQQAALRRLACHWRCLAARCEESESARKPAA